MRLLRCPASLCVESESLPTLQLHSIAMAHEDSVWALAVCGGRLVSAGVDKLVKLWHEDRPCREEDAVRLQGHQGPVFTTLVDQCHVLSGASDGLVFVWDFHSDRGGSVKELWETGLALDIS